jgi:hypothetical protein
MRFIIAVIDSKTGSATGDEISAIDEFNDKLQANGHFILACGIDDPGNAVVIDNRADAGLLYIGPLYDQKEYMAGFWVISAESVEEAKALAAEGSKACNRKVEVRALHG